MSCRRFEKFSGSGCAVCDLLEKDHPLLPSTDACCCCTKFQPLAGTKCCTNCGLSEVTHQRKHQLCRVVPHDKVPSQRNVAPHLFPLSFRARRELGARAPKLYYVTNAALQQNFYFYTIPISALPESSLGVVPRCFKPQDERVVDTNYWYEGETIPEAHDVDKWKLVDPSNDSSNSTDDLVSKMKIDSFFGYGEYDVIVNFHDVMSLYREGWEVRQMSDFDFLKTEKHTLHVAITGHFNAGKTFIVHHLSGSPLPHGLTVHTKGLSIKFTEVPGSDNTCYIAWYDQAGQNSRVERAEEEPIVANGETPTSSAETPTSSAEVAKKMMTLRTRLAESAATENLLRNFALHVSDVYIHVISGTVTSTEQLELLSIALRSRQLNVKKDIVVIHNLKTWTLKDLQDTPKGGGIAYIDKVAEIFTCLKTPMGQGVYRLDGHLDGNSSSPVAVHHFFLLNHDNEHTWNDAVFKDIRSRIHNVLSITDAPRKHIAQALTHIQRTFATVSKNSPQQVDFTDDGKRLRADDTGAKLIDSSQGRRLTLADPDTPYNISEVPFDTQLWGHSKSTLVLQLAVPGIDGGREEVERIWKQLKANARREQDAGKKMVVIEFTTKVHLCHDENDGNTHVLDHFFPGKSVELASGPREELLGGSRPHFDTTSRVRDLTVYKRFDISDEVNTCYPCFVDYTAGILSIGYLTKVSKKPNKDTLNHTSTAPSSHVDPSRS